MSTPLRFAAVLAVILAVVLAAASRAQPTLERTSCLHPLTQDRAGVNLSLTAADWDDDGRDDLVLGAPFWDYEPGNETQNGRFGSYHWDPFVPSDWEQLGGIFGEAGSQMGRVVAAGDFDEDGRIDLALGIPGWSATPGNIFEGAVEILFGSAALFRDGFDTGDTGRWSAAP